MKNIDVEEQESSQEADNQLEQSPEQENAFLNLDTSVLLERKNAVKQSAIMDIYGIKIFDQDIEAQILLYQAEESKKNDFYKNIVFFPQKTQDRELLEIRRNLFSITYSASREGNKAKDSSSSWQNAAMTVLLLLLLLLIGGSYGRWKQKERDKRLADINNNYDE